MKAAIKNKKPWRQYWNQKFKDTTMALIPPCGV